MAKFGETMRRDHAARPCGETMRREHPARPMRRDPCGETHAVRLMRRDPCGETTCVEVMGWGFGGSEVSAAVALDALEGGWDSLDDIPSCLDGWGE